MKNRIIVTGAAGFIGSNLVDRLLDEDFEVIGIDNFSTGNKENLKNAFLNNRFRLIEADLFNDELNPEVFEKTHAIFHLAANADVRFGPDHPSLDLEQNIYVTHRVLEAARKFHVKKFVFASTGSVYGEASIIPTPENAPFPTQTSLYGASKVSAEALASAYSESFGLEVCIFRFVSILGPRYSHGHVVDFFDQLCNNPNELKVLGNGLQKKSYLHVDDCVEAVMFGYRNMRKGVEVFNLGTNEFCTVKESISWICDELQVNPQLVFGTEDRGWIGDNPFIFLDVRKMQKLGWSPKNSIEHSVRDTVRYLESRRQL